MVTYLKNCSVEFVDGCDLSALNFTPNAASQQRTSTFQQDVLPRCWQGPPTWSIWFGRRSHISDAYIIVSGLSTLRVASALAILQQHVLKRSAAEDGPVPVNSSSLWTNLRLLIKNDGVTYLLKFVIGTFWYLFGSLQVLLMENVMLFVYVQ